MDAQGNDAIVYDVIATQPHLHRSVHDESVELPSNTAQDSLQPDMFAPEQLQLTL